jgi:cobalt-zinc-cadmium efflux system outer membrane protein
LREQLPLLVETQLQRWRNAAIQVEAAQQRAQLAEETRQLLDKSFRLGQTDLPTRLRVELEAFEAQRLAQRTRIEQAALLSEWRQSLGLLPTP